MTNLSYRILMAGLLLCVGVKSAQSQRPEQEIHRSDVGQVDVSVSASSVALSDVQEWASQAEPVAVTRDGTIWLLGHASLLRTGEGQTGTRINFILNGSACTILGATATGSSLHVDLRATSDQATDQGKAASHIVHAVIDCETLEVVGALDDTLAFMPLQDATATAACRVYIDVSGRRRINVYPDGWAAERPLGAVEQADYRPGGRYVRWSVCGQRICGAEFVDKRLVVRFLGDDKAVSTNFTADNLFVSQAAVNADATLAAVVVSLRDVEGGGRVEPPDRVLLVRLDSGEVVWNTAIEVPRNGFIRVRWQTLDGGWISFASDDWTAFNVQGLRKRELGERRVFDACGNLKAIREPRNR